MISQEFEFRGTVGDFGLHRAVEALHKLGLDVEVLEARVGRRREDEAEGVLLVRASGPDAMGEGEAAVAANGGRRVDRADARLEPALADAALPAGFCSTTNHPTEVRVGGGWIAVERQKMDAAIVVSPDRATAACRTMGDVRKGDLVVVGDAGVRVHAPREAFGFMGSAVSSERPASTLAARIAREVAEVRKAGEKVCVVAGPAVVHTGAAEALASLIRDGIVDVLFGGNALAAHDIERQMFGTSLGADMEGRPLAGGHRHHLYAINEVRSAGSIRALVERGRLKAGIMFEATRRGIPVVLAGSIRDDGPLPEVVTDVMEAQRRMRDHLDGVGLVLMLATLLHSVAVGNLLPSRVRTVCVDINPATVTKLSDRGTSHAVGLVTDVGIFLPLLAAEIRRGLA